MLQCTQARFRILVAAKWPIYQLTYIYVSYVAAVDVRAVKGVIKSSTALKICQTSDLLGYLSDV